jgi:hypothetical protein
LQEFSRSQRARKEEKVSYMMLSNPFPSNIRQILRPFSIYSTGLNARRAPRRTLLTNLITCLNINVAFERVSSFTPTTTITMADILKPWIAAYLIGIAETHGADLAGVPVSPKSQKGQIIRVWALVLHRGLRFH